ncbi:unnamed protein product [Rangifer tarandus platyrhynchus]|uniref:Uncharacterized protein n=2 Tax=Rangifer tarandus platyrhynchus TaxID=3082113 RepID=A0ABN8YSI3_RANTA|nr:unnamed protein product [Rangifer tarandus platyrhynchus]
MTCLHKASVDCYYNSILVEFSFYLVFFVKSGTELHLLCYSPSPNIYILKNVVRVYFYFCEVLVFGLLAPALHCPLRLCLSPSVSSLRLLHFLLPLSLCLYLVCVLKVFIWVGESKYS